MVNRNPFTADWKQPGQVLSHLPEDSLICCRHVGSGKNVLSVDLANANSPYRKLIPKINVRH